VELAVGGKRSRLCSQTNPKLLRNPRSTGLDLAIVWDAVADQEAMLRV
jgi:hypothetical protein